ncbi:MAG TPA: HAMP domain-containing sensor histidine kinase [Lapillicoccus sp.]|uniref:sensor histidine kinase n=1 Tax=Lapillicoccus sp. TaxID=1909287 RepID=UPI002F925DED
MSSSLRAERHDAALVEPDQPDAVIEPATASARTPLPRWATPGAWTLRGKLVASMLVLFFVVSVLTGATTVLFLRQVLTGQVDQQLQSSITRFRSLPPQPITRGGPGDQGLTAAISTDGSFPSSGTAQGRDPGSEPQALTTEELEILSTAGLGAAPQTITLGELGSYRVLASAGTITNRQTGVVSPAIAVIGLSMSRQNATIVNTGLAVTGGVLLGLVVVGIGGMWLVRRNLRPLDRVAATATRVAHLPLSEGKVDIVERVPLQDTDTRTEVGQVGAAFNEMLDHIDHALNQRQKSEERVRQFVADASHELRTPLASIRGYAELTRREQEPVPQGVTYAIGRVESEAIRMTALVDDLLLLARLDAGRPLDHETVDLTEMVVNAVSDAHAASPDHVWQLDLPDEPVEVQGDPARLHQIVVNLLGNARTHTAPGTVVRTSIVPDDGQVRLAVRDNGPGVPQELQANVFQRFARGDTSRNRAAGSTGLGLSIVAAVAQAHGGSVSLDSEPGDTTFTVLLPA